MMSKAGLKRRKEHRSRVTAYETLKSKLSIYQCSRGSEREMLLREINELAEKLQIKSH